MGLGLSLIALLLYLRNPEPQPLSDPDAGGGRIEAEAPAEEPSDPVEGAAEAEMAAQDQTQQSEAIEPSQERDSLATAKGALEVETSGPAEAESAPDASDTPTAEEPAGEPQSAALALIVPSFDIVRVEKDGSTLIAGRATPGAEVEVLTGLDKPLPGAAVEADGRGEFVALPDEPLRPGEYELRLRSRLSPDGDWLNSDQSVLVVVPERRALADAGEAEVEGEPAGVMTVLLSDQPGAAARVMQSPEGLGISSGDLALEIIDYDAEGNLIIAGKAPPEARLFVYLDNEGLADTRADAAGRWNAIPANPVGAGAHRLRVDQLGADGKVVARVETQFYRAPGEAQTADGGEVEVVPGNSLWRIARRTYGRGIRYTLIYQANKDQIRNPDLIYPGQIFILPEDSSVTQ